MSIERKVRPTNEEIEDAIEVLNRIEPGFYSPELFFALERLVPWPAIEIVPLRISSEGNVQVLLTKRGEDDPFWPNELHVPGTMISPKDESLSAAFDRLKSRELAGIDLSDPVFVKEYLHDTKRGKELALVYWVETEGEPTDGKYYDVDNLPEDTIEHHIPIIKAAASKYLNNL